MRQQDPTQMRVCVPKSGGFFGTSERATRKKCMCAAPPATAPAVSPRERASERERARESESDITLCRRHRRRHAWHSSDSFYFSHTNTSNTRTALVRYAAHTERPSELNVSANLNLPGIVSSELARTCGERQSELGQNWTLRTTKLERASVLVIFSHDSP